MSQTGVVAWSQTAASNSTADSSVNWAEGMAPSAVNDSARAQMASVAKYRDDQAGSLTTGGTSTAYTLTTNQVFSALTVLNGQSLRVRFNATNGAAPTLNVDGLGAKAIQSASGTAIGTGVLLANSIWDLTYDNSIPAFIVEGAAQVQTGSLANSSVTYAKIQNVADQKVLGNVSGAPAAPSEIGFGTGIVITGGNITAPAVPVPAVYKNLSIKVATNTTVTVAADFVTVTDGTNYQTLAFSGTVNLGTTGTNALDTGTIAIDTWYAIWAIAKADGTTALLASTSFTAPSPMPAGYTYKARVGAVQTVHATATLYGTWQFGNIGQYVVGLASTSIVPNVANGVIGTYASTVPTWVAKQIRGNGFFVPSTASRAFVLANTNFKGGTSAAIQVAPNSSYRGFQETNGNYPPIDTGSGPTVGIHRADLLLESDSIYVTSSATGGSVAVLGWEDNI